MQIETLTRTEEAILAALSTYTYLTSKQLLRLGVTRNRRHLYSTLANLAARKAAPLGYLEYGAEPALGRLHRPYYLTRQGAALLEATGLDDHDIHYPKRVRKFRNDYFHRLRTIDVHIIVREWAELHGATVDYFHTYFDYAGPNARSRVPLTHGVVVPDAVFSLTQDNVPRLFALEVHNGKETKRVARQITRYFDALAENAIERTFNYVQEGLVRLLCVFTELSVLQHVQARFKTRADLREFDAQVFLNTLPETDRDFRSGWHRLSGSAQPASLF